MTAETEIVWLDDEPHSTAAYADELEESFQKRYTLRRVRSALDALAYIADRSSPPALLIWDMIVPPGDSLSLPETQNGLRTGEVLFTRFRQKWPNLAAILFTNIATPAVRQRFHAPDQHLFAAVKREFLPEDFVVLVERALGLNAELEISE